ncbi:MOSC domain-containing protein [Salibaculum halophilum]|uniref:MOSC domain-containing protein n=1 Tax=Salibaculum halophilum TaxID=1914408 RepID=UPI000A10F7A2|nr:MOSC domain-containing protein [Salibaculum halophilum]
MPALTPTDHHATITWVGRMTERVEPAVNGEALDRLDLGFGGLADAPYAGRTRASCSRVTAQHPKGTEIANVRQLSIVSAEELAQVAADMGLAALDPAWLGVNLVIQGLADFSHVPPSSRLQAEGGTTLVIDMQNRPCHQPGLTVDRHHTGHGKAFKAAAEGRRGVTAWVERPGALVIGDRLRLHVPDQRRWAP